MHKDFFKITGAACAMVLLGAGCARQITPAPASPQPTSTPIAAPTPQAPTSTPSAIPTLQPTSTYPLTKELPPLDGDNQLATKAIVKPGATPMPGAGGTTQLVATKGYSAALNVYGQAGWRFQFVNCGGSPGTMSVKRGNKFMLDNRDNTTHHFKIGNSAYTLRAYEFAIVTAIKTGKHQITCDGGGSATVYINN